MTLHLWGARRQSLAVSGTGLVRQRVGGVIFVLGGPWQVVSIVGDVGHIRQAAHRPRS
jgi:hypothetical protein